jgi:NAD(P)-dependent dehydrogenase (short-subunit alcohol dehydrogenase family)
MQSLSGEVALVTGATGGIGWATALALAAAGAKVVAAGRRQAEGDGTVPLLRGAGGEGHFVAADVSHDEDVERIIEAAVERFGGCAARPTSPESTAMWASRTPPSNNSTSSWARISAACGSACATN